MDYKSCSLRTNPSISVARQVSASLASKYVRRQANFGGLTDVTYPSTTLCGDSWPCTGRESPKDFVVLLHRYLPFPRSGHAGQGALHLTSRGISSLRSENRAQMRFNPDLTELIPKEQLDSAFGGDFEYEFEPVSYWEQIVSYVATQSLRGGRRPGLTVSLLLHFCVTAHAESRRMGRAFARRPATIPRAQKETRRRGRSRYRQYSPCTPSRPLRVRNSERQSWSKRRHRTRIRRRMLCTVKP